MRVLIYNKDLFFLKAFSDFLPSKFPDIILDTFSIRDIALEHMNSGEEYDVIIGTEDFLKLAPENALHIVASTRTFIPENNGQNIYLNIYQRKDGIASDLKRIISKKTEGGASLMWEDSNTKIVSVISPQGGSGKTTCAYLIAAAAVKCGLKPAFISLEPFAALNKLCDDCRESGFGDIVFALKDGRDAQSVLMEKLYKNQHEVSMLPVPDNLEDLLSITKEDFAHLADAFSQLPEVDVVVIDVGFPPSEAIVEVLRRSHVIAITANASSTGDKKLERLMKDPFVGLNKMGAEIITLWNKCPVSREISDCDAALPYSESIAKGVPVGTVLSGNKAVFDACKVVLKAANRR